MKRIESANCRLLGLLVTAVMLAFSVAASGQDGGPEYINVRIVTIKADQATLWVRLQREANQALIAQGEGFRHIFQRMYGPVGTFLVISPDNAGPLPTAEDWGAAVAGSIVSRNVVRLQVYPDAFTLQDGATPVPTEFMFARLRTVAPGQNGDYYEWQRDELIPALREANPRGDTRTLRVALGGNPGTWVRFSFVDELPGSGPNPLMESMGQQAAQRMLGRGSALETQAENYFYRYRSDLSFDAP